MIRSLISGPLFRSPMFRSKRRVSWGVSAGFTLIELMVVIGIIVLAAGLMTPTIADFFKNRQLETIRGHIGAAFNKARLNAVNKGTKASLVFFREGVRVYLEKERRFDEEDLFRPETSPLSDDSVWYVLGFLEKKNSFELESYRSWESRHSHLQSETASRAEKQGAGTTDQVDVRGLPKITFERDGSLTFVTGADVPISEFKKEIPDTADIVIYSSMSNTACFIDLRLPGQMRARMVPLKENPPKPQVKVQVGRDADLAPEGGAPEGGAPEGNAEAEREDEAESSAAHEPAAEKPSAEKPPKAQKPEAEDEEDGESATTSEDAGGEKK